MANFIDYFALLGIARTASDIEIKSAWYEKSLATHPDRRGCVAGTEEWEMWNEKQAQLNTGKEILMDAWKRRAYLYEYDNRPNCGASEYQEWQAREASCSYSTSATNSEILAHEEPICRQLDRILAQLDEFRRIIQMLNRNLGEMTENLDRLNGNIESRRNH